MLLCKLIAHTIKGKDFAELARLYDAQQAIHNSNIAQLEAVVRRGKESAAESVTLHAKVMTASIMWWTYTPRMPCAHDADCDDGGNAACRNGPGRHHHGTHPRCGRAT